METKPNVLGEVERIYPEAHTFDPLFFCEKQWVSGKGRAVWLPARRIDQKQSL